MDMNDYNCKTAKQIKKSEKYYKKKMDDLVNRINKLHVDIQDMKNKEK